MTGRERRYDEEQQTNKCRFRAPIPAERRNMGEPNNALKVYMRRADRIRSVLEYYIGGKLPEDWTFEKEEDFYTVRDLRGKLSFRQRDEIKRVRTGEGSFLLGLENQETVNLAYPLRLMEMDCCTYRAGVEEIRERNDGDCENNGNSGYQASDRNHNKTTGKAGNGIRYGKQDDFKYRYREADRLEPLLSLTLYWGRPEWKRPLSLWDMMDQKRLPEELKGLFGDYKVHLIHMRQIPEEALKKMDSDLKYVLGLMKRTGSPKKYEAYIKENSEFFSRIPKSAFDVIDVCTRIKDIRSCIKFEQKQEDREEEGDMCKALNDIQKNARNKGKEEGRLEGRAEGITEGRAEEIIEGGYEYGLSEESILEKLQRKLNISERKAQGYLRMFGRQPV